MGNNIILKAKTQKVLGWLFVLIFGPFLVYITIKYHLSNAPVNPLLPYFVIVLFLPAWEAGVGFLIAVSSSTYTALTAPHVSPENPVRLAILLFFFVLIVRVKVQLHRRSQERTNLIREQTQLEVFKYMVQYSPLAILVENVKGQILLVNNEATAVFGYSEDEFLHAQSDIIIPQDERVNSHKWRNRVWEHVTERESHSFLNMTLARKGGNTFLADVYTSWVPWGHNNIVALRITVLDQTAHNKLQIQLNEERMRVHIAEESLAMRDRFIAIAAHELKTPFATIQLYLDLLQSHFKSQELPEPKLYIEAIQRQVDTVTTLINQLFDTSIIKNDSLPIIKKKINLNHVVVKTTEIGRIMSAKHDVVVDIPNDLTLEADRLRLDQVLINLLTNAIKYSPNDGGILIKAWEEKNLIIMTVRDHGLGIPKEVQSHLFERFFQAHPDRSGLGLGLYISKQIIEKHGGSIAFSDPADGAGGSQFTIILPKK